MSALRMGLHIHGAHDKAEAYIRVVQPPVVKFLDSAPGRLVDLVHSYGGMTILRVYRKDQEPGSYGDYLREIEQRTRGSAVKAIEVSFNEAMQAGDRLAAKAALDIEGMRLAERLGKTAVIGSFSVGMPDLPDDPARAGEQWARYRPALEHAAAHGHLLGIHEYGGGAMGMDAGITGNGAEARGWYCLRYRKVLDWARSAGLRMPRIVITESGIDDLTPQVQPATRGYRTAASLHPPSIGDYASQAVRYARHLAEDGTAVLGWVDFGFGAIDEWADFDLARDPAMLGRMTQEMSALAAPPAAPPKEIPTMAPISSIAGEHHSSRLGKTPRYLVLHSAANSAIATPAAVARYLAHNGVGASAHYLVGENEIWRIVDEGRAAHHAGGSTLPDGTTGRVTQGDSWVDAVNAVTIGVEMMQTVGQSVRPAVLETAIPLLVDICRRNGIPASNVVSHRDISAHATQGAHSDPVGVDMGVVRARVAAALGGRPAPAPVPVQSPGQALLIAVDKAHRATGITLNPSAALQRSIRADGLIPTTREIEVVDGGVTYVAQRAESLGGGGAHVYYVVKGDWAHIHKVPAL